MKTSFPRDQIRVALFEGIHPRAVDLFRAAGYTVDQHAGALTGEELRAVLRMAHVVGIRSKTRLTPDLIPEASRLLAIGCFCIGTNQVSLDTARDSGVPVFNAPFSNTRSVAELTLAEIIALHRRLGHRSRAMHAGRWQKSAIGSHEVRGRTLGIVGYGRIGSQVSVLAEALGMRVLYHDIRPVLALGNARAVASLPELLAQSDVITLHVPATAETANMIDAAAIASMPGGAMLINNARGSVVDVDALAAAIRSAHIAGAAIDVFPSEPQRGEDDFESPLCGLPNVLLSPHIGGSTEEAQEAIALDAAEKLIRFIDNGSTTGAVNVPQVDLPAQVESAARPHRILHFHRNVPGVLSSIHRVISDVGANVSAEYLRTDGDLGYVVLEVEPADGERILAGMRAIPETIRVRALW